MHTRAPWGNADGQVHDAPAWGPETAVAEELELIACRKAAEDAAAEAGRPRVLFPEDADEQAQARDAFVEKAEDFLQYLGGQLSSTLAAAADAAAAMVPRTPTTASSSRPPASAETVERRGTHAGRGTKRQQVAAAVPEERSVSLQVPGTQKDLVPLVTTQLRDWQVSGVRWLIAAYCTAVNGILADQNGLGRRVQAIAFLSHLKSRGIGGPFLVLAPLASLTTWADEFAKHCPSMATLVYHGSRSERAKLFRSTVRRVAVGPCPDDFPVILTSYEVLMADSKALQKVSFKYLIADEGRGLRNHITPSLLDAVQTLDVRNRLLLTGAALPSRLCELWPLLCFHAPDLVDGMRDCARLVSTLYSAHGEEAQRTVLEAKLRRHLMSVSLRRLHQDLPCVLPARTEVVLYAPMTAAQQAAHNALLSNPIVAEMTGVVAEGGSTYAGTVKIQRLLAQMCINCDHPQLLGSLAACCPDSPSTSSASPSSPQSPPSPSSSSSSWTSPEDSSSPPSCSAARPGCQEQSGKVALLGRLLDALHERGHKVLLFAQTSSTLSMLELYTMARFDSPQQRIDGCRLSFQAQRKAVRDLNSGASDTWLFLLPKSAGQRGITLTGADTVILFDSDWDPLADVQAMERCHRVGQTQPVLVLRLITQHSVESRMLEHAQERRQQLRQGARREDNQTAVGCSPPQLRDLLDLLQASPTTSTQQQGDVSQSGVISNKVLHSLLDHRCALALMAPGQVLPSAPYKAQGVGYCVLPVGQDGG